jgi:hypothetical protein
VGHCRSPSGGGGIGHAKAGAKKDGGGGGGGGIVSKAPPFSLLDKRVVDLLLNEIREEVKYVCRYPLPAAADDLMMRAKAMGIMGLIGWLIYRLMNLVGKYGGHQIF